jgi:hypothetical protein
MAVKEVPDENSVDHNLQLAKSHQHYQNKSTDAKPSPPTACVL